MKRIGLTLMAILLMFPNGISQIILVPDDKPSIQAGIDFASDGDTVVVSEATYLENINFNGKAITVASRFILDGDTSHISKTIIDGSQSTRPDTGTVVMMCSGEDSTSVLMGFTITGGSGTVLDYGTGNVSENDFGGGGIAIVHGGGKIVHNIVEGNKITKHPRYDWAMGSGIYASARGKSTCVIRDNVIRNNEIHGPVAYGAALFLYSGRHIVEGNIITNNLTVGSQYLFGGTIYWAPVLDTGSIKEVIIRNNFISDNVSQCPDNPYGGTIGFANSMNAFIKFHNNIITNNQMDGVGGGIYIYGTWIDMANNTILNNKATKEGNSAYVGGDATVAMYNNILWSETAPNISDIAFESNSSPYLWAHHNILVEPIIESARTDSKGNIYSTPVFGDDGVELAASSPGIGWGLDSFQYFTTTFFPPEKDIRGNSRPDPIDGRIDLGAIESPYLGYVLILDTAFLNALIEAGVDTNGDSLIIYEESAEVVFLDVSGNAISDLTGLGAFENLDTLICSGNELTELDLSENEGIRYLDCSNNPLFTLNLSANTELGTIILDGMPELDLVCVWSDSFPEGEVLLSIEGSPNVYFSTTCLKEQPPFQIADKFQEFNLDHPDLQIKSRLFIPDSYDADKVYPLVITLHGADEVGGDNYIQVLNNYIATSWATNDFQAGHPCFVFSPTCPTGNWTTSSNYQAVRYLLDSLRSIYSIDTDRIYLTGASLGGWGTWEYLGLDPELYAAAIPVCGWVQLELPAQYVEMVKKIPVWDFHGNADETVDVSNSQAIFKAYMDSGEFPVLTHHWFRKEINLTDQEVSDYIDNYTDHLYSELPGVGHDASNTAYQTPLAREWLFRQRKRSDEYLTVEKSGERVRVSGEHEFFFQCADPVERVSIWLGHFNSCDWEFLADVDPSEGTFVFDSRTAVDHPFARLRFLAHDSIGSVIDKEYSDYLCLDNDGNGFPFLEITNDFSIERDNTSLKNYEMALRLGDPEGLALNVSILVSTDNGASFHPLANFETDEEVWTEVINMEHILNTNTVIFRVEATDGEYTVTYQGLAFLNERGCKNVSIPDTVFLNTLIGLGADKGRDGQINSYEAELVTNITSMGYTGYGQIHDLTGIEAFVYLDSLVLVDHSIKNMDLSSNENLIYLRAACALETLDISNCQYLRNLQLQKGEPEWQNLLSTLDISKNPDLEELNLSGMENLTEVCVASLPFPPEGMVIDTSACHNICFQVDCDGNCETTGIEDITAGKILILPNPVDDILRIETPGFGGFKVSISSANGKEILEKINSEATTQLDLSSLPNGVYFITIRSRDFVTTRKVVKL